MDTRFSIDFIKIEKSFACYYKQRWMVRSKLPLTQEKIGKIMVLMGYYHQSIDILEDYKEEDKLDKFNSFYCYKILTTTDSSG